MHLVGVAGEDDLAGRAGRWRRRRRDARSVSPAASGSARTARLSPTASSSSASTRDAPHAAEPDERPGRQDAAQLGLHGLGDLQAAVRLGRVHRLVRRLVVVGLDRRRRHPRHGAVAAHVLAVVRLQHHQAVAVQAPGLLRALGDADHRVDRVRVRSWRWPTAGLDRAVEVASARRSARARSTPGRSTSATRSVAGADVDARVDRQQLVHGRQRAQQRRLRSATFSGPSFLTNPLTRKSTAFSEPRCGVPNVISARVSCQPSRHSR